jgi:parvulin-like peptidyl-prolyl isomerase
MNCFVVPFIRPRQDPGRLHRIPPSLARLLSLPLVLALALVSGHSEAAAAEQFELVNGIAAQANEAIITIHDVRQASAPAMNLVERTYYNNPQQFQKKADQAISDALELLLERQLKLHEFKTAGGNLPDSIIDDEIKDRIRQQFGDRATLIKNLQAQGITYEAYRQRTREEIILSYMERKNVREALLISPAKIEAYYKTNLTRYQLGNQIKLRMITLNRPQGVSVDEVKTVAMDIRKKILEGVSFADMASSYSEGSQRKEGGLLGWVEESALSPLSKMALPLAPGQCSSIIGLAREPDDSYWLYEYDSAGAVARGRRFSSRDVLLEEKQFNGTERAEAMSAPQSLYLLAVDERKVAHTRSLQEVRDEIEKELLVLERSRLHKKWVERLKSKSFVTYF